MTAASQLAILSASLALLFAACPGSRLQEAQVKSAEVELQALENEVHLWLLKNPSGCPTLDELSRPSTDPWNRKIEITCDDSGGELRSAGPDGASGNADDIVRRWAS